MTLITYFLRWTFLKEKLATALVFSDFNLKKGKGQRTVDRTFKECISV